MKTHLTEEEKAKIIEEEELRAVTRQKIQDEMKKAEDEPSKDGIFAFYWFDDSLLGNIKAIALTLFLIMVLSGIAQIFK